MPSTNSFERAIPASIAGASRVESILAAAAAIVDEAGPGGLTTTGTAHASGAAVGTVYRYFPDRLSLLVALGRRNRALLLERLADALRGRNHRPDTLAEAYIDVLSAAFREIPSMRALSIGERVPGQIREPWPWSEIAKPLLARSATDLDVGKIERACALIDAMVSAAFRVEVSGDADMLLDVRQAGHDLFEAALIQDDLA